jgi:endo-1,4-beta-D-glucanase Y
MSAMIVDEVHAKSTGRKPQADVDRQKAENFFSRTGPDCTKQGTINETAEGTDTLFGYTAVRFSAWIGENKTERDAALSRDVSWRLPEFNCVIAQDFWQTRASKTEQWKTTQGNRLTSIAAAEPDPALFTNWLNYDEMKPSDITRKIAIAHGCTPRCFAPDPTDANYEKWHENEK